MRSFNRLVTTAVLSFFLFANVFAQSSSNYDYVKAFDPVFYHKNGDEFRSASGKPGPKYWQNSADYRIQAVLNDDNREITAKVVIDYTNNSPDKLDYLWVQLDHNMFK